MTKTFKVGDRVRVSKIGDARFKVGDTATVRDVSSHESPGLEFDRNVGGHDLFAGPDGVRDGHGWYWTTGFYGELELIEESEKPAFKVGDRVRMNRSKSLYHFPLSTSTTYVIQGAGEGIDSGNFLIAREEIPRVPLATVKPQWLTRVPAEAPKPTYSQPHIVVLREDGVFKPSPNPFVHSSKARADKEARRLADRVKGKEFVVFAAVSSAKAEKVTRTVTEFAPALTRSV